MKGNAMNPDLTAFRRAGGKLIMWHGWDDQTVPAVGTLDYYERVTRQAGGSEATQQFARLFMVPTVYHCAMDGYRLNTVDPFPALVDWVERGQAPRHIVAEQRDTAGQVLRSRPVFAYPLLSVYDGTGSIDDASNFVPAPPRTRTIDRIDWAGTDLYHRPGPVAR